jgi:signal transduction histidine kinase
LLAAGNARDKEISAFGAFVLSLAIVGFGVSNGVNGDWKAIGRLLAEVVAIAVVTLLLLRNAAARRACEWRYQSIFRRSRFPIWELDFSRVIPLLGDLKAMGASDLAEFCRRTSGFLDSLKEEIKILDMNDAMFVHFGMTPGVDEMPPNIASIAVDDDRLLEVLQAVANGEEHCDGRGRIIRRDGRSVDVMLGVSMDLSGSRPGSVIGTLVDVSEREEANKALAAAHAELARASRVATVGTVSASIAHELNQPLGAILLNAQTCLRYLRREAPDIESAVSAAERTVREGNRAAAIVRETREMVARRRQRHEPLGLVGLIEDVVELVSRDVKDAGVEISLNKPAQEAWILGDKVALQQALFNLVSNALHAVSDRHCGKRKLTIALALVGEQATVRVRDTGHGISEDILDRIFDSFFTTKEDGTGMGLTISRTAIEAHGGVLKARNCESGGAEFEFAIPLWVGGTEKRAALATGLMQREEKSSGAGPVRVASKPGLRGSSTRASASR